VVSFIAQYKEDDGTGSGSGGADALGRYTVSVSGGSGSGSYTPGTVVTIGAYASNSGYTFDRWTTSSSGVGFLDRNAPQTTFTMPANNVTITATYKTSLSSSTGTGNANTGNASGTGDGDDSVANGAFGDTNAKVEILKPGFPNHEVASATVNGALDNFVVRITDDPNATALVIEALQKEYGNLDQIIFTAMDITLYDETGTYKITDTTGLSVTITLPIPSLTAQYGASNIAASAADGELERLGGRITTIDGVPVVTFTATHFSPYTVYVDLDNLAAGVADQTPKTGDALHPKWYLVIGLASLSLVLFFRKEKIVALA
jgi:uncharacterized repeat protein (TIGR02543 family)